MASEVKLHVLTYNVCWECMTGSASGSAGVLGERCGKAGATPTPCLVQAAKNVDATIEQIAGPDGVSLVGIQEASRWRDLQKASKFLSGMSVLYDKLHAEEIALFFSSFLDLQWFRLGSVSKRPLQVALFHHRQLPRSKLLVVHLHNHHGDKGTKEVIQKSLRAIPELETLVDSLPEDTVILCLGDWNDPQGSIPGFAPFERFRQSPIRKKQVTYMGSLPKSCCSTKPNDHSRSRVGDYVLSSPPSSPALNKVSLTALKEASQVARGVPWLLDASDHFPVYATVRLKAPFKPPSRTAAVSAPARSTELDPSGREWRAKGGPFCVVSGYVRAKYIEGGLLAARRTLRLQDDLTDPNKQPHLGGRKHRGQTVEEGSPLLQLRKPSASTGLVLVLAKVPLERCGLR